MLFCFVFSCPLLQWTRRDKAHTHTQATHHTLTELDSSLLEGLCKLLQLLQIGHLVGVQIGGSAAAATSIGTGREGRLWKMRRGRRGRRRRCLVVVMAVVVAAAACW